MTQTELMKALQTLLGKQPTTRRKRTKKAKGKLSEAEKAAFIVKNDAECVAAFAAKGFKDVQPRVNVLTYDRWVEKGRRVKKGEKAVKVGPFNLFHEAQTEVLPLAEQTPANQAAA